MTKKSSSNTLIIAWLLQDRRRSQANLQTDDVIMIIGLLHNILESISLSQVLQFDHNALLS